MPARSNLSLSHQALPHLSRSLSLALSLSLSLSLSITLSLTLAHSNLMDAFKMEDLLAMKSREAFVDSLADISQQSKNFFILSSKYFDTVS